MSSERRRVTTLFVVTTLGLVVALGVQPISVEQILAAYVLAVAAIVLAALTRVLASRSALDQPSRFEQLLARRPHEVTRPAELMRIEREITLGGSSLGHLHSRLLPLLRDAAAARVGLDFERHPERARRLLGDETWDLLRPDRPAPADRNAPGLALRRVRAVVDTLERL